MKFKILIKKYRQNQNLTQKQLAEILGIPLGTVNSWEQGYGHPRFKMIKPLCKALDIEIADLFIYDEE